MSDFYASLAILAIPVLALIRSFWLCHKNYDKIQEATRVEKAKKFHSTKRKAKRWARNSERK